MRQRNNKSEQIYLINKFKSIGFLSSNMLNTFNEQQIINLMLLDLNRVVINGEVKKQIKYCFLDPVFLNSEYYLEDIYDICSTNDDDLATMYTTLAFDKDSYTSKHHRFDKLIIKSCLERNDLERDDIVTIASYLVDNAIDKTLQQSQFYIDGMMMIANSLSVSLAKEIHDLSKDLELVNNQDAYLEKINEIDMIFRNHIKQKKR